MKKFKFRLSMMMGALGMSGILAMLFLLPSLLASHPSKLSISVLLCIQLFQSSALLGVAVWVGVTLAPKVGLNAPALEALAYKESFITALRPQIRPGFIGAMVMGSVLVCMSFITPQELISAFPINIHPMLKILTEILYGGLTEEILLRWGMMTFFLWLLWRFIQCNQNRPSFLLIWSAIAGSALLFALGHLPAAQVLTGGHLTYHIIAYVLIGNLLAGIIFGFLYQRFGLESAMIAHAGAHFVADTVLLLK